MRLKFADNSVISGVLSVRLQEASVEKKVRKSTASRLPAWHETIRADWYSALSIDEKFTHRDDLVRHIAERSSSLGIVTSVINRGYPMFL